jgi:outer membrane lipoprotein-sorting protein
MIDRMHAAPLIRLLAGACGVLLLAGATPATAQDDQPTGLSIMKKADRARRADTERITMTMTLENSRGQTRVRTIESWNRRITEDEEHRFSRFKEPADVKDTTLLTYDYVSKDDDIWLYLPALKKVKRILSSNKSDYFMGSDFTYEDMENFDFVNWDYAIPGKEAVEGAECWIVDAVPNNDKKRSESGYSKVRYWVALEDDLVRKIEYTDKKGRMSKMMTTSDIRPVSDTDPRKRSRKLKMQNFVTKHTTHLDYLQIELDVAVDDEIFSQRNLQP